jgi:hypothetical protein
MAARIRGVAFASSSLTVLSLANLHENRPARGIEGIVRSG